MTKKTRKIDLSKIGNATLRFLVDISQFADEVIEPLTLSGMRRNLYQNWSPKKISDHLGNLQRTGYIKIDRKSDSIEFTMKGKIKLLENPTNIAIDGKWRMLSWDIPEKFRTKRQQFCRSIRRIGYKQVQKSLWVCPFVRAEEITLIINELGLKKYVAYLRVDKTDIESHLKKLFRN